MNKSLRITHSAFSAARPTSSSQCHMESETSRELRLEWNTTFTAPVLWIRSIAYR
jgi:hypothetical protein